MVKDSFTAQPIRRYPLSIINKNILYGQVKNQFNYRVRDLLATLLIYRAPYVFPVLHFRYLSNERYKDNNFLKKCRPLHFIENNSSKVF
jgi:hypothetical protein